VLEVGSRSLIEPTDSILVNSIISKYLPMDTSLVNPYIITALPEKTFLEKAFLLHEIFTGGGDMAADRKSRHLYDLEKMMDKEFAVEAIANDTLWNSIQHHRAVFTHIKGVDYHSDIRRNIHLVPPQSVIADWERDYASMKQSMIYEKDPLSFSELIRRMATLQDRFRKLPSK
jgi:hypothetical protein